MHVHFLHVVFMCHQCVLAIHLPSIPFLGENIVYSLVASVVSKHLARSSMYSCLKVDFSHICFSQMQ